ncbi:hypothetical protein N431DRAFT_429535 [Stipitochalara longipes BDJ]|nr:hypothetical protein N431DRAFT_429535 [Stipitochalara longipes BDJ]
MSHNPSKRTFDSFTEANGTSSSSKKPRVNAATLLNTIRALPTETTQTLLHEFSQHDPMIAARIQDTFKAHLAKLAAKPPLNFDHYSKECWYTLNKKYARLRPSQQYGMMGDIMGELSDARTAMMEKAGPETRFETRRNALEVLRKICKSIMLCDEQQIRHELKKDGMVLGEFAESMMDLANGMTREERAKYKEEGLYEKLVELQGECESSDMEGLADVYAAFDDDEDDDEGDDEGGEDYDDGDDSLEAIPATTISAPVTKRTRVFSVGELS